MARPCNKPLKANPFMARRDSQTGRWQVVKAPASKRKNVVKKPQHPNAGHPQTYFPAVKGMLLQA